MFFFFLLTLLSVFLLIDGIIGTNTLVVFSFLELSQPSTEPLSASRSGARRSSISEQREQRRNSPRDSSK